LTSDLHECLRSPQLQGRIVLEVFRRKLEQETRLVAAMESVDFSYAAQLVSGLKTLTKIDDVGRFQGTSLKHWPRLIPHLRSKASQSNLSVAELLRSMRNDPENEAVIGQMTKQNSFVQTIDDIKLRATSEPRSQWSQKDIDNWVTNIKECRAEVDLVDFLSVAFRAVQLQMN
ncbi:Uncharacterized protein APZ42_002292, partial [Daphnia magna]